MPSKKAMQSAQQCVESFPTHLHPPMAMEEAIADAVRRVATAIDKAVDEMREEAVAAERKRCAGICTKMEQEFRRQSNTTDMAAGASACRLAIYCDF